MNCLQKKKIAFMSIVNSVKGFVRTITGVLPLTIEGCVDDESIIDYTLYGQSVQNGTPTPEMPIEVESVGEKTTNLFNINDIESYYPLNSNSNIKKVDGNFVIKRTASAYSMGISFSYPFKAGKYALKIGYLTTNYSPKSAQIMYFADKSICVNASSVGYPNTVKQLNIPEDMTVTIVIYANDDNVVGNECTFSIMLSEGYDSVPYEPYGYKIPIKVSGKNLLNLSAVGGKFTHYGVTFTKNKDNSITMNGTSTMDFPVSISTDNGFTAGGGTYTLCGCFGGSTSTYYMQTQNGFTDTGRGVIVSIKEDKNIVRLYVKKGAVLDNVTVYPMLLKGNYVGKVPDYEPYHEPITTNIYLDEPLRKVGDYADYIKSVDLVNGTGTVVRRVYECNMTEVFNTLNIKAVIYGKYTNVIRFSHNLNIMKCKNGKANCKTISNRFISTNADSFKDDKECVFFHDALNTHFYTSLQKDRLGIGETDTDSEILNKHAEYVKNNDTKVYYALAKPTETPITLPTIPTFKGTSIISADTTVQPSNVEIEYYSNVKE